MRIQFLKTGEAKDKKFCTNTRTDDFHIACVTACMLHSSDRYEKSITSLEAENFIVDYFSRVNDDYRSPTNDKKIQ